MPGTSRRDLRETNNMKHPIFHVDEEARVGQRAYDRRMIGRCCTIKCIMPPVGGEHRYAVRTASGIHTVVLESTLVKLFERGRWINCAWQPRWEAR